MPDGIVELDPATKGEAAALRSRTQFIPTLFADAILVSAVIIARMNGLHLMRSSWGINVVTSRVGPRT